MFRVDGKHQLLLVHVPLGTVAIWVFGYGCLGWLGMGVGIGVGVCCCSGTSSVISVGVGSRGGEKGVLRLSDSTSQMRPWVGITVARASLGFTGSPSTECLE